MIPHAFLQDLLNRIDIVDVVGRYVPLKKGGANFMGLCPFHNEKSPSFTVSPAKQFYHCFGCGAHGTAIGFLMEHAALSFPEAVGELAQSVGLSVPQERSGGASLAGAAPQRASNGLTELMQRAAEYYRRQLRSAPQAIEYLKKRGLTGEVAARFGLGFAPDGWQNLEEVFERYRDDALVEAGLVIISNKETDNPGPDNAEKRRYDRFRDRIMFPIRNARGLVIAFGGRVLDKGEPKYLNSPETPLFSKGSELYGLYEGRLEIREKGYALVVEGYMDVVALAQHGFPNAVATLGTACTPTHVQKLFRQTDTVVFSFDGDAAGRRAARRALEACLPHAADNRTIRFLFLPPEHDPDSFVREQGAPAFEAALDDALPLSQFLLNEILSGKALDQPEGRAKALFEAKPLLQALPPNAFRGQIVQRLAVRLGTPIEEVATLCELAGERPVAAPRAPSRGERRRVTGNEHRALRTLIMFPHLVVELSEDDLLTLCEATRHRELFVEVIEHAQALGARADFQLLSDLLRHSANSATYEEIFREILDYDENVRDLSLSNLQGGSADQPVNEQARLALEELRGSILKLLFEALSERCQDYASQSKLTPEQNAEYRQLLRQTAEIKKRLSTASES